MLQSLGALYALRIRFFERWMNPRLAIVEPFLPSSTATCRYVKDAHAHTPTSHCGVVVVVVVVLLPSLLLPLVLLFLFISITCSQRKRTLINRYATLQSRSSTQRTRRPTLLRAAHLACRGFPWQRGPGHSRAIVFNPFLVLSMVVVCFRLLGFLIHLQFFIMSVPI